MKDIPMFTTPFGVASLSLREVPYRKTAYIRIVATETCEALINECVSFCRLCGAERIYAEGHSDLNQYPFYTAVWNMCCSKMQFDTKAEMLYPVLSENVDHWREIYNKRMVDVPLAAYMTEADGKALCKSGEGYFVHRNGALLGIGRVSGDRIRVIASVCKGSGSQVLCTLAGLTDSPTISVEVASENFTAVSFYQKMGFIKTAEIARWYCVYDSGKHWTGDNNFAVNNCYDIK